MIVQLPLPKHIDSYKVHQKTQLFLERKQTTMTLIAEDTTQVIQCIDPSKDVDGLHAVNIGSAVLGRCAHSLLFLLHTWFVCLVSFVYFIFRSSGLLPCTPQAVMEIFERCGVSTSSPFRHFFYYFTLVHYPTHSPLQISLERRHVVVVGRSNLVGKPLANLLLGENMNNSVLLFCYFFFFSALPLFALSIASHTHSIKR